MSEAGLNSMIQASKDHLIDAIDFSRLGRPTASYVTDRRTVRLPFLAPEYKPDGVTVMRCTLADHGWLDPATCYLQCLVTNTMDVAGSELVPCTSSKRTCLLRAANLEASTRPTLSTSRVSCQLIALSRFGSSPPPLQFTCQCTP